MSDSALAKYREHRLEGVRTYDLYEDKIVIRGSMRVGVNFESNIKLSGVQPEIHRIWMRSQLFTLAVVVFVVGLLFVFIATQLENIRAVDSLIAIASFAFPLIGLVAVLLTMHKLEYVRFANNNSIVVFDLARSGPDSNNFDEFVNKIVKQIEASHQASLSDTSKVLTETVKENLEN
jgi:hypothetical protein